MELLLVLGVPFAGGIVLAFWGHRSFAPELNSMMSLATFAARSHKRVLLMDLDVRHPSVHRELGWSVSHGLVESLMEDRPLDDVIQHELETGHGLAQRAGRLDAAAIGQVVVDEDHLRVGGGRGPDRVRHRAGPADDGQVFGAVEEQRQPLGHEVVVVDHQHAHRRRHEAHLRAPTESESRLAP